MYFPISDILNNTAFGIPKNNTQDINDIISAILSKAKSK